MSGEQPCWQCRTETMCAELHTHDTPVFFCGPCLLAALRTIGRFELQGMTVESVATVATPVAAPGLVIYEPGPNDVVYGAERYGGQRTQGGE